MPTPFYHLWIAQNLLEHPDLGANARQLLNHQRAEFMFGNTAPDVQTISQQSRQDTHFLSLPTYPGQPSPVEAMLTANPPLRPTRSLPAAQAAFLAGYLCHLHADWLWVRLIFEPVFGSAASWAGTAHRLYIHNVLRAHLDRLVVPNLAVGTSTCLAQVQPLHWLPFVADEYLHQWRDLLHPQLQAHAPPQTVEVFAARQGIPPQAYYRLLDSSERMEQEVFAYISPQQMESYRSLLLSESIHLLRRYLEYPAAGLFHQPSTGVGFYETS